MTREEAIQELAAWRRKLEKLNQPIDAEAWDMAVEALKDERQERELGKWIYKGEHGDFAWSCDGRGQSWHLYECNQCHKTEKRDTLFCPNCGADMRGGCL